VKTLPATLKNRTARAREVLARCDALATFSEDAHSLRRTFLSAPMHNCHAEIRSWLSRLGIAPTVDAVGNIRGYYPGLNENSPRLLIGSHLDTVPNAGKYDGILGVVLAIALLEELDGARLPFGIEVIGFSEEEGVRFGVPFIGSRALVGRVDEELLNCRDCNGFSVREAIQQFGLESTRVSEAIVRENALGFLEFHIEQGPILEKSGHSLAAVDTIAGQTRGVLHFAGKSNHAGTTPMNARQDALAGAAEWISAVEKTAKETHGLVATIGSIEAKPGATNVIPGDVRLSLDVRHKLDHTRLQAVQRFFALANQIATKRGLAAHWNPLLEQCAVALDSFLVDQIEAAIHGSGCEPLRMTSGSGHDAMILAERVPAAMIFLRSPGGVSHDPAETVLLQDVERAIECGVNLLTQLAASNEFLERHLRAQSWSNQKRASS
jgi:allantoate deiminase